MKRCLSTVKELDKSDYASLESIDPYILGAIAIEMMSAIDDRIMQDLYDEIGERCLFFPSDPQKVLGDDAPFFLKEKDLQEREISLPPFELYPDAKIIICHFQKVDGCQSIVVDKTW